MSKKKKKKKSWICPGCSALNLAGSLVCLICGTKRKNGATIKITRKKN